MMLHYKAIEPRCLELLKKLQCIPKFSEFRLVGGTALALHLDHRLTNCIEISTSSSNDNFDLHSALSLLNYSIARRTNYLTEINIEGISVDISFYPYPWIKEAIIDNEITLAHIEDIAAIKLHTISSETSKEDFFDIAVLLEQLSLKDMLGFYTKKFTAATLDSVLKSLLSFENTEMELDPIMSVDLNWSQVKEKITSAVKSL